MPVHRQARPDAGPTSLTWPSGGRHLWPSGDSSEAQTHARGHLVYAARGVLVLHTESGTSIVPANRVAWTPAGFTHRHRAHGDTDMRIVFLPPSLARLVPGRPAVFRVSGLAREVLLALTDPRRNGHDGPGGGSGAVPAYSRTARERLLRVLVEELREADEQPLHLPHPRDDRLRSIEQILSRTPADATTLAGLGRRVGASARTLSRLLRDELGMTFYEWRTQLRVHHALVLLAEGHDTTHTAHACGWANPSGFIAAFTDLVGTTPGRYRAGG
ncbi:AraC family transcriptional regulator [Streptomyces sp. SDr-06]|uniref:AraC family transcriptional regulator n=1 Tax=Streptomyces sp. SDr-06 TaxID=2267702 RepID=UPI000DEB9A8A|nr:helix-turn-helix transcriptional regulator [Streptomyces sp. SDr-06]RCH64225.1 AraC family transcriptional regulator [Streptomyces sp. SDr-06]